MVELWVDHHPLSLMDERVNLVDQAQNRIENVHGPFSVCYMTSSVVEIEIIQIVEVAPIEAWAVVASTRELARQFWEVEVV